MDKSKILEQKFLKLFPNEKEREEVRAILLTYGEESHEPEADRVRLAILKASGTDPTPDKIRSNTKAAKGDFRDILCWVEYPRYAKKVVNA